MRPNLLETLRCPACGAEGLALTPLEESGTEVREGEAACPACSAAFPVRGGILDLMHGATEQVRAELAAWESMLDTSSYTEEEHSRCRAWLRSLPFLAGQEGAPADLQAWRRHGREAFRLLDRAEWRGKRVLEPGAGRCWLSAELARRGAEVVALDITPAPYLGLSSAEVFLEEGVWFERVLADMQRLPFKDASFDAVVATATLHHSPGLEGLARELARVTRPGGLLLAANEPLLLPFRRKTAEEAAGAHEGSHTLLRWMRALERAGWLLESVGVGAWGDLHLAASRGGGGSLPRSARLKAHLRYLKLACLAPPRRLAESARAFAALHPMRPAPGDPAGWLSARALRRPAAPGLPLYGPGWYPPEGGSEPFRWSGPRSRALLPPPPPGAALLLELASFRPGIASEPVRVEVRLGKKRLGAVELDRPGWTARSLAVPPSCSGRGPLTLTIAVRRGWYVPADLGLGGDHRRLGAACRRLSWEPPGP